MRFLLDTNVLSEAVAKAPRAEIVSWVERQSPDDIHLSVVTIGEIDFGIARLAEGLKRLRLQAWRDAIVERTGRRLLPIDLAVVAAWGEVRARAQAEHRTLPVLDAFLAATAEVHGLTLVTRNTKDFEVWGGAVFNPWLEA